MTKRLGLVVLMAGLSAGIASDLLAQTPYEPASRVFVNVNAGAQPSRRDISTSNSFTLYDEQASIATQQHIGNGPVFDVSGGYRVWKNVAIGVGYTSFSDTGSSSVTATIPDPVVHDTPKTVTSTADGLEHTERTVHVLAVYFVPVTDKIDVALSIGPSFVSVKQQLVSSVTVPPGTQTINTVVSDEDASTTGFSVGVDGNYFFTPNIGVGILLRYTAASVDLPSAAGLTVAGFNGGLGVRIRF